MRLRIKDWDRSFENHKSREREQCSFVCIPNKMGEGRRYLLGIQDGLAFMGLFLNLAEACSTHPLPRAGYCTSGGKPTDRPWELDDIATWYCRGDANFASRAIQVLVSHKVAWIEDLDAPALCPSSTREAPRKKEGTKEGKNERKNEELAAQVSAVTADAAQAVADSPIVLTFPTIAGKRNKAGEWHLRADYVAELLEIYPSLDVAGECRKALGWVRADSGNRKTADRMKVFLVNWMSRSQNSGRGRNRGSHGQPKPTAADRGEFPEPEPNLPILNERGAGGGRAPSRGDNGTGKP